MAAQPGYPKETVVAEKLEALTALGLLNNRMKDYYDLFFPECILFRESAW